MKHSLQYAALNFTHLVKNFNFAIFEKKYEDFRNDSFLSVGEGPFTHTIMQILTFGHDTWTGSSPDPVVWFKDFLSKLKVSYLFLRELL